MPTFIGFSTINQNKKFTAVDFELIKIDLLNAFNIRQGELVGRPGYGTVIWSYLFENQTEETEDENQFVLSRRERIDYSKGQVKEIFQKVWLYILIGVGIGAAIHNWIPQELINSILGKDNPFSVLIAAIVSIPMYADIFGTLPIAEALYLKGVGIGTILTFMMGVTALSLPSMVMLSKVVKPKLLLIFISIITIGIIFIGYLFNSFSYLFI